MESLENETARIIGTLAGRYFKTTEKVHALEREQEDLRAIQPRDLGSAWRAHLDRLAQAWHFRRGVRVGLGIALAHLTGAYS